MRVDNLIVKIDHRIITLLIRHSDAKLRNSAISQEFLLIIVDRIEDSVRNQKQGDLLSKLEALCPSLCTKQ